MNVLHSNVHNKHILIRMEEIVEGALITKEKRHELFGTVAGGAGSMKPEEWQRAKIVEGTGVPCPKTSMRVNLRTNLLRHIAFPNKDPDGFDYSEDFDGVQIAGERTVYINLKCIVGKGGAQTRSLREVYWFVEGQLRFLDSERIANIYFANILDGDEAANNKNKFEYLLGLSEFSEHARGRVYVGDLKGYIPWFNALSTSGDVR